MGLIAAVKRSFWSIVPLVNRGGAGVFVTCLPTGAGLLGAGAITLTGKATALNYGAVVTAISAIANTTECWIEAIVLANPQVAKKDYYVAVTTAVAITAAAQIAAEVSWNRPGLVTDAVVLPLGQRVFIPANVAIGLALAESSGGKTCDAWVVISRNK